MMDCQTMQQLALPLRFSLSGSLPESAEVGHCMPELLRYCHEYQRQKQEDPS